MKYIREWLWTSVIIWRSEPFSLCLSVYMRISQHICVSMEKYLICIASAWQILLGTDCDHGREEDSGLAQTYQGEVK